MLNGSPASRGHAKVSVHVAAYNQEPYLAQALVSIINCAFDDLEIIVFND